MLFRRYDRHFAPNVSLAPQPVSSKGEEDKDDLKDEEEKMVTENGWHDSDQDSKEGSPPASPPKVVKRPLQVTLAPEHETHLQMLRCALEGKVGKSAEEQEQFVEEFVRVQARQEEKFRSVACLNYDLRKVRKHESSIIGANCVTHIRLCCN